MIPQEEVQQRIAKLQSALQAREMDGALLIQRADLYYFSGTGQNGHLFVPARGEPTLAVRKSLARARQESPLDQIIPLQGWDELRAIIARNTSEGAVIGLESDVLPAKTQERYQKKILAGYNLNDVSPLVREVRAIKTPYEIEQMRLAAAINEAVFQRAAEVIKAGLSELELSAALEYQARILGHQGFIRMRGFNQELYYGHVMTGGSAATSTFFDGPTGGPGLNPSFPQGPGLTTIKPGEPILVDFVSTFNGYMVDQTRIFSIGELDPDLTAAYRQALLIKKTLQEEGRPGVNGQSLFAIAEELAAEGGLANHFMGYTDKVYFIGHGVGLELDELPVIARGIDKPLQEGMVFAMEPKFVFPGRGTVGVEDTFLVGCRGLEQLTRFDDRLQIL